jgi:hypothetical protein
MEQNRELLTLMYECKDCNDIKKQTKIHLR